MESRFSDAVKRMPSTVEQLTYELTATMLRDVCHALRDEEAFRFEQLMDVCGVDYLGYGENEWRTQSATVTGFSRGVNRHALQAGERTQRRFAVVYHLLSLTHMHRIRIKCRVPEDDPAIPSVVSIWAGANWVERETFDLYGIRFTDHPDLRRIFLYDEFVGHPLRKDYKKEDEQPIEPYAGPGANEPRRPN